MTNKPIKKNYDGTEALPEHQLPSKTQEWTVPQLSIMIIYNSTWPILIQWIRDILSGDNLT